MSIDGGSTKYMLLDSSFRNRKEWPSPTEFGVKFMGNQKNNSVSELDLVLKGATVGIGSPYGEPLSYFQYYRSWIKAAWGSLPNTTTTILFDAGDGDATFICPLTMGPGVTLEDLKRLYDGLHIEFYDDLNPTLSYSTTVVNYRPYEVNVQPEEFFWPVQMELMPSLNVDLVNLPVFSVLFSLRQFGNAVVHGTITEANPNSVTLFPGHFVSLEKDFYKGKYFLFVDTDDRANYMFSDLVTRLSAANLNTHHIYPIVAYDEKTFTVYFDRKVQHLPQAGTRYEILDLHRPNESYLSIPTSLNNYNTKNYEVSLIQMSLPSGVFGMQQSTDRSDISLSGLGFQNLSYLLVELTNMSGYSSSKNHITNNPSLLKASFVVFVREDENPSSVRSLMSSSETHVMSFKFNDSVKVSVKTPDGNLLIYQMVDVYGVIARWQDGTLLYDNFPPYPPDPNRQLQFLFSFRNK